MSSMKWVVERSKEGRVRITQVQEFDLSEGEEAEDALMEITDNLEEGPEIEAWAAAYRIVAGHKFIAGGCRFHWADGLIKKGLALDPPTEAEFHRLRAEGLAESRRRVPADERVEIG